METENKKKKVKNFSEKNNIVIAVVVSVAFSAVVSVGGTILALKLFPNSYETTITNVSKLEKDVTVTDTGIADAVEKVYDAVAVVENYKTSSSTKKDTLYATGTGFFYKKVDNTYYMLTNYHVIEGASKISIVLTSGDRVDVTLVGGDKYADIAVLSYETEAELTVAQLGDSSALRVGDTVFAIGAPLDSELYSGTTTRGIISGKDREVSVSLSNSYTADWIMHVLQTDTAINSGNSGGPLCNSNGEVIGINNMKLSSTGVEGMGFAIPIEEAVSYAESIISDGKIIRPYIGIAMSDVNTNSIFGYATNTSTTDGVLISQVESGSPADEAGLKQGDIITKLGDVDIDSVATLRYQLYKYKAGDTVKVTYVRNDKTETTNVKLIANS